MSTLTPRERVLQAVRHVQPDRVPWQLSFTVPARLKLEAYYGTTDLDTVLGNHMARVRARLPHEEIRPGYGRDEFGIVWNKTVDKDIGVVEDFPLKKRSLAGFKFPDAHNPRRSAALPAFMETNRDRFRFVSVGMSLFERAWTLRSMPELMVDMIEDPAWVDELYDAIVEYDLGLIAEFAKFDFDGILFGDDWGQQRGLMFSPRLWRRFIKPRVAVLYGAVKQAGKVVMIHSCGKVQELFPDLIELGLDVFNPFQPDVMDPYDMKAQFGSSLSFYGGVSVQNLLPFGTPQQVRDEARRLMDKVGRDGGFIIAPSHDMPGDIPVENMVAFAEAVRG